MLGDTSKLEKEKLQLENEAEVLIELLKKHVEKNNELITELDEKLWNVTIDKVIVDLKSSIKFYFIDGTNVLREL